VYDKAPDVEQVFGEDFDLWNNLLYVDERRKWLEDHGATNVTIPYKQNRAVMFDSKRLHATDNYNFKTGYENRRINLTLLFGDARIHERYEADVMRSEYKAF
jgi:hypothetical protein